MRIGSSLPFNIARAYGVGMADRARSSAAASPIAQVAPPRSSDGVGTGPTSAGIEQLVGGRVAGGIDFESSASPRSTTGPVAGIYQLYTRAADRVEAAARMQIGRSIDVQG